jgi:hypothetical protein
MMRAAAVAALVLLPAGAAIAAGAVTKRGWQTVAIAPGRTRTVNVAYPDALKYANATYSGAVKVLGPAPGSSGGAPSRSLVRIVSAGSALGGSEYRAVIHNANAAGTAPERVEVAAITREPPR